MEQNNQGQNPKRQLLQTLMQKVLGAAGGKSIQEVISGIKDAIGAYKNYAKEWDTLHGAVQGQSPRPSQSQPMRQLPPMPKQMPMPQAPQGMPMPPAPQSMPTQRDPNQEIGVGWGP